MAHEKSRLFFNPCIFSLSFVFVLLFRQSPTTVSRLVVPIIVNPIKRVERSVIGGSTLWTITHIGYEVRKVVPSFAHADASPPIIGVAWVPRVVATLPHICPDRVEWVGLAKAVVVTHTFFVPLQHTSLSKKFAVMDLTVFTACFEACRLIAPIHDTYSCTHAIIIPHQNQA